MGFGFGQSASVQTRANLSQQIKGNCYWLAQPKADKNWLDYMLLLFGSAPYDFQAKMALTPYPPADVVLDEEVFGRTLTTLVAAQTTFFSS